MIWENILQKVRNILIITLGDKGCLLVRDKKYKYYPAFKVKALDTTGAGDIFNAAFCNYDSKRKFN
ncbi:MAG: PfkB family carbohydrate kinase [Christensenellales bacterium]